MRILLSLSLLLSMVVFGISAQNCNCDYTITQSGNYNPSNLPVKAGQTICIQQGLYSDLYFSDFKGENGKPITIINCGGNVEIQGLNVGIQFSNCRYFRLTGSGNSSLLYGFKVSSQASNSMGIKVTDRSSDCEIDHLEITNVGFAGMMIKTDPSCDMNNWENRFTMYNVKIHHNYVHHTGGEGLYVGSSFWNYGQDINCFGTTINAKPHLIYGLEINHNKIENTGAEGIQYGCAPDAKVHHNTVTHPGSAPFAEFQNNGIQVGGGSGGECYSNIVSEVPGVGIIMIGGIGHQNVYNNLVYNTGNSGIFSDTRPRSTENTPVRIYNNTVINTGSESLKIYSLIQNYEVFNNAFLLSATGRYINAPAGVQFSQEKNFSSNLLDEANFQAPSQNNYKPRLTSPLVNQGKDLNYMNLSYDLSDTLRPIGGAFDIGCYEYAGSWLTQENTPIEELLPYPNPSSEVAYINLPVGNQFISLEIFDLSGRKVDEKEITPVLENLYAIDLKALPASTYIIQLRQVTGTRSISPIFRGKLQKIN